MSTNLSSKDAYSLMLKDYPDVMNIDQMCEILASPPAGASSPIKIK